MVTKSDIEHLRRRDGDEHPRRPDWVNDVFSDAAALGYENGASLGGDDDGYGHYPDGEGDDITDPRYGPLIEEVLRHPLVSTIEDAVEELKYTNPEQLESVARFHGLDVVTLLGLEPDTYELEDVAEVSEGCPADHIQVGEDDYWPLEWTRYVCWESGHLLAKLMCDCGMSAEETALWISLHYDEHDPDERDIREAAKATGLLNGGPHIGYLTKEGDKRRQLKH